MIITIFKCLNTIFTQEHLGSGASTKLIRVITALRSFLFINGEDCVKKRIKKEINNASSDTS